MNRILIFGNSGSGKSTLAKALCSERALAHLDLDSLAWEKADPPTRRSVSESAKEIRMFLKLKSHNIPLRSSAYARSDVQHPAASAPEFAISSNGIAMPLIALFRAFRIA